MMQSFHYFSGLSHPLLIVNDGTLTKQDVHLLQRFFVVTVITKQTLLRKIALLLRGYPYLRRFILDEYTPIIKWKIALMLSNPSKKYMFIDSDILFFQRPQEIIKWFTSDVSYCLNLEYAERERTFKYSDDENYLDVYHAYRTSLKMLQFPHANTLFNNGIFCVPDSSLIQPKQLNTILRVVHNSYFDNQFGTDELILSCLLDRQQTRSLPKLLYRIQLDSVRKKHERLICKHYCWRAKVLFPRDAIVLALRTRFFKPVNI